MRDGVLYCWPSIFTKAVNAAVVTMLLGIISFPMNSVISLVILRSHFHTSGGFSSEARTISTGGCGTVRISTTKSGQSRNKRAEPTCFPTFLCWVTKPSERVSKTWSYTRCYSEITLKHPVWYGQVTDIFATQTAGGLT